MDDKSAPPPSATYHHHHHNTHDFLRSPSLPAEPAPAYTALPHRDTDFHLAPVLNGRVGEVELETVDGKRFLVHRKVLENETVFFHIYYGFVPVWRLNGAAPTPYYHASSTVPHSQSRPIRSTTTTEIAPASTTGSAGTTTQALNNLLCNSLPKIIASLRPSAPNVEIRPLLHPQDGMDTDDHEHQHHEHHHEHDQEANYDAPPPLPPKDTHPHPTAPTPTTSPYVWSVPESSTVLEAFLALIYPRYTITPCSDPSTMLTHLDITGRVIRAALGYQSSKALGMARDRLSGFITTHPVEVYAMATFFKFGDLAKLASISAVKVPVNEWSANSRGLMGRGAAGMLGELQTCRMEGMREILARPIEIDVELSNGEGRGDGHTAGCAGWPMMKRYWEERAQAVARNLKPNSELLELLELQLPDTDGEGYCGQCLAAVARNVQRCLMEVRELPGCI